jgi:hypothetical protein
MAKMEYRVTITTSKDPKAGTNDDVWCQLVGQNGETAVCHFDKGNYDDFESGDTDTYTIIDEDVGPLAYIQFALTREGSFAGEISLTVAGDFKGVSAGMEFNNVEKWGSGHNSPMWKLARARVDCSPLGSVMLTQSATFTADRWLAPGEVIRISNDAGTGGSASSQDVKKVNDMLREIFT